MKTFRRDKLRRLVEQGKVVTVSTYSFDDMHGESRTSKEMPCAMKPADYRDMQPGTCYMGPWDFTTKSGSAWLNPDGTVTLYVHSNSSYKLRIKE